MLFVSVVVVGLWAMEENNNVHKSLTLGRAIEKGDIQRATQLISDGVDVNALEEGSMPLHRAASKGQMHLVQLLVERGADFRAISSGGITPLASAQSSRSERSSDIVNYLEKVLCNAPKRTPKNLTEAIVDNDKERVVALLDAGADIEAPDSVRWKPLHLAAWLDRYEIGQLLVERGADYNAKDFRNCTPLAYAELQRARLFTYLAFIPILGINQ